MDRVYGLWSKMMFETSKKFYLTPRRPNRKEPLSFTMSKEKKMMVFLQMVERRRRILSAARMTKTGNGKEDQDDEKDKTVT